MSDKETIKNRLKLIQRARYLIPCTCKLCKKKFDDVIIGEDHVYQEHKDRKLSNVVENLKWDIVEDNKNWKILKDIESKRNNILRALNDDEMLISSNIPKNFSIGKEDYNLKKIVDGTKELEKTKKDKLIDKLDNRISKFMDKFLGDNYLIGKDVLKTPNKRKITKFEKSLDEILGLKKAYLLLTNSSLKKKIEKLEQESESETEDEEELPGEEEPEEE